VELILTCFLIEKPILSIELVGNHLIAIG